MAAGLSDHMWELDELIGLMPQAGREGVGKCEASCRVGVNHSRQRALETPHGCRAHGVYCGKLPPLLSHRVSHFGDVLTVAPLILARVLPPLRSCACPRWGHDKARSSASEREHTEKQRDLLGLAHGSRMPSSFALRNST